MVWGNKSFRKSRAIWLAAILAGCCCAAHSTINAGTDTVILGPEDTGSVICFIRGQNIGSLPDGIKLRNFVPAYVAFWHHHRVHTAVCQFLPRQKPPKHQRRQPASVPSIMTRATMPVFHACVMAGLIMRCWLACAADKLDYTQIVLSSLQLAG